jgi:hypothetical protein
MPVKLTKILDEVEMVIGMLEQKIQDRRIAGLALS